jgi:Gpi18-like mannosyltransferase/GAF domain-containing protein
MGGNSGWFRRIAGVRNVRVIPGPERLILVTLIGIAVLMRVVGRNHVTSDLVVFADWYDQLRARGGVPGLREPIGNYNAPFLYLLVVAGYLPGATLLKLKAIFALFDALVVYFMFRIVALRYSGWRIPALAALVSAFLPTVVVNASMYGQCDSIWASFALGGLYWLLRGRYWWAAAFFATAVAFKPQAIFVLPVLLMLVLVGRVRWRVLVALPAVYLLLDLPAIAAGRDPGELLTVYARQMDEQGSLARSAPSVFQFLPVTVGADVLRGLGYLFAAAVVLGVCYVFVATRARLDTARLVTAAAFFAIAVPFLLPSMHERYFYLADLLTVALAFYRPRLWPLPLTVQAASALSYLPFLSRGGPQGPFVDAKLLSTLMLAALVTTAYTLVRDAVPRTAGAAPDGTDPISEPVGFKHDRFGVVGAAAAAIDTSADTHLVETVGLLRQVTVEIVTSSDLDQALRRLADLAVELAPGPAWCGISVLRHGEPGLAAGSRSFPAVLEEEQYRRGEGPCLTAMSDREIVVSADLTTERRWPAWCRLAVRHGARAVACYPMDVDTGVIGALNMYPSTDAPLSRSAHLTAMLVAEQAGLLLGVVLDRNRDRARIERLSAAVAAKRVSTVVRVGAGPGDPAAERTEERVGASRPGMLSALARRIVHHVVAGHPDPSINIRNDSR